MQRRQPLLVCCIHIGLVRYEQLHDVTVTIFVTCSSQVSAKERIERECETPGIAGAEIVRSFPCVSTGSFRAPQFLHKRGEDCDCVNFHAAAQCLQSSVRCSEAVPKKVWHCR